MGLLARLTRADCETIYSVEPVALPTCPSGNASSGIAYGLGLGWHVVGDYITCFGAGPKAFTWAPDEGFSAATLPSGFQNSIATDVTADGQVVGTMFADLVFTFTPFLATGGTAVELELPPTFTGGWAIAVNDSGQMAGYCESRSSLSACVWIDGRPGTLELPVGPSSKATDINNLRQVCGWMGVFPSPPWSSSGFVYDGGDVAVIESPIDGATVETLEINDAGIVLGRLDVPNSESSGETTLSFTWQRGVLTMIDRRPA